MFELFAWLGWALAGAGWFAFYLELGTSKFHQDQCYQLSKAIDEGCDVGEVVTHARYEPLKVVK